MRTRARPLATLCGGSDLISLSRMLTQLACGLTGRTALAWVPGGALGDHEPTSRSHVVLSGGSTYGLLSLLYLLSRALEQVTSLSRVYHVSRYTGTSGVVCAPGCAYRYSVGRRRPIGASCAGICGAVSVECHSALSWGSSWVTTHCAEVVGSLRPTACLGVCT